MTGFGRLRVVSVSIPAAILALGIGGSASAAASPDFDQATGDVAALVGSLKKKAEGDKSKDIKAAYNATRRSDRDCVTFRFEPTGPTVSEAVWLRSTEYRRECTYDGRGGRHCHEVPGWTYRERVQVELRNRQELFPWEREAVAVCLDGPWLSVHEVELAHKYTSQRQGGYYTLTAGERKLMNPDKHGIEAGAPESTGDNVAVNFADKWASYYAGEQTVLMVKLKREIKNWFDPTLVEKELTFTAADNYKIDFGEYASEFSEKLKPGKKYYVEWKFKRISKISKDTKIKRGDGPTGTYQPKLFLVWR